MIELNAGDATVQISTMGGAVIRFDINGTAVLRPASLDAIKTDILHAACFPCVPFFGRINSNTQVRDRNYQLNPTHPDIGVVHGVGWVSNWSIAAQSVSEVQLELSHAAGDDRSWPFPFIARQNIILLPDALKIELSLQNLHSRPVPAGLGLHPYFPREDSTLVRMEAAATWNPQMTAPYIGGVEETLPDTIGSSLDAPLPVTHRDRTYTNLKSDVLIKSARSKIRLQTDAPHLHLYAPANADYFCLEPITQLPGALFHSPLLAPDASLTISMTIARI